MKKNWHIAIMVNDLIIVHREVETAENDKPSEANCEKHCQNSKNELII